MERLFLAAGLSSSGRTIIVAPKLIESEAIAKFNKRIVATE